MTLAEPHVGVHAVLVKTLAVGLLLCGKHKLAHTLGRKELLGTVSEHAGLEEVTGVDIYDNLSCVHKLALDKSNLGITVGALGDCGIHYENLVEGRCSLGNRHGILTVEGRILIYLAIVEGMAELVCESNDIREGAVEVGEYSALSCAVNGTVECAANLTLTGEEVDPCIVKCILYHIVKLAVELSKDAEEIITCVLGGVLLITLAHRSKEVVPRKTALVTKCLCLRAKVLTECRHILLHCGEKRIKSLTLHSRVVKRLCKRRLIATASRLTDNLELNGVKSECNRGLDLGVSRKLCLEGRLSCLLVRVVSKVSYGGESNLLAPIINLKRAGKAGLEVRPSGCTGDIHLGKERFLRIGEKVLRILNDRKDSVGMLLKNVVTCDNGLDILNLCNSLIDSGGGSGNGRKLAHQNTHGAGRLVVSGVCAVTKVCVDNKLLCKAGKLGLKLNMLKKKCLGRIAGKIAAELKNLGNCGVKILKIGCEFGRIKARIENGKIPLLVHNNYTFLLFLSSRSETILA